MIRSEIIDTISKHLGVTPADIDPTASLADDLSLGPIEKSDLLASLAAHFKITFSPSEVVQIETVEDLIALVEDTLLE